MRLEIRFIGSRPTKVKPVISWQVFKNSYCGIVILLVAGASCHDDPLYTFVT
ncbi:hypothetical protein Z946_1740 [Sulfitobacter noctilucicola]|nr:hypothetical protein Z946_1740 [Sulfitobacter noctilucicola]